MNVDVSVVMPLYNAKKYFKLTVDSILAQTLKNIEVVIVDDCSTDGSLELCRELYGSNDRVRILKQAKNMGPGAARNTGIRSASGDYVLFVDSDDELMPDMLSKMLETAKQFNADVVHNTQFLFPLKEEGPLPLQLLDESLKFVPVGPESNSYLQVTPLPEDLTSRLDLWSNRKISLSICNKMFRKAFLMDNGIFFSDMKCAEDMVFCFECLSKSQNYVILPGGGYVYRIMENSLSRGKNSSAGIIKALKSQIEGVHTMRRILSEVPFFAANPDKARAALERVLIDIEVSYIRPAYQVLGYEVLRSDEALSEFFKETFGEKAPYVEFMFHDLHRRYESVVDFTNQLGDMEYWKDTVKAAEEKEQGKQ